MPIRSLADARAAACAQIPNEVLRNIIFTRVFVRTGVNLRQLRPDQARDPRRLADVLATFDELGYPLTGASDG